MAIKTTKKENIYFVINCLVVFIIGFGTFIYSIHPDLTDFRNSIYGLIVNFLVLAGIILYVTLSRKISMPLLGKITVWVYGLLFILSSIFDFGRIEMLFFFIYAIGNVCVAIYLYKKHGIAYKSIWLFGAFSYLSTAFIVLRVKYLHDEFTSPFMWVSIIVSIIVFIPCLIYAIRYFMPYRDWENLIGLPLGALLCSFAFVWLTVSSMNVYLDTSAPTYEEYIIMDKDIRAGSRQATTYEFEVKKDDTTFTIGVSETTYYSHEINDTIKLSIYSGAFNEPYYIHENSSK
jgi:hypothetical protein